MTLSKYMGIQDTDISKIMGADIADISKVMGATVSLVSTGTFSFDVTTAGADTFELPINGGGAGYTQSFDVDWGDTNSSTITSYDDADRTHNYAGAGTYTVVLDGSCEWFAFENGGDKDLVVELNSFTGDMGFKILNFWGCANLTTIVALGTMASLTIATDMFRECSALTAITSGLFDGCSGMNNVGGFSFTFYICQSITSIPSGLFRYQPNLTTGAFTSTFNNCISLTSIVSGLFDYNTSVTSGAFNNTFSGCTGLTAIVSGLFDFNTAITATAFNNTFYNCSNASLTSIPSGLFDYQTLITSAAFRQTFSTCNKLTGIVLGLFDYNTLMTSSAFYETFLYCAGLTTIVSGLFDNQTNLTSDAFYGTFNRCNNASLTDIPSGLFDYQTGLTIYGFFNTFISTQITSVVAGLFDYQVSMTSGFQECFRNCSVLATVPSELFKFNTACIYFGQAFRDCPKMQQVSDLFCTGGDEGTRFLNQSVNFQGCFDRDSFTGVQGTAPALWSFTFGTGTPTTTDTWEGAGNSLTSLTNYASIPGAWK